jgi:hypothetical protein
LSPDFIRASMPCCWRERSSGAILQNLLSGRDPQLAIHYTLVVVTLVFMGGGKYSLDARIFAKTETHLTQA